MSTDSGSSPTIEELQAQEKDGKERVDVETNEKGSQVKVLPFPTDHQPKDETAMDKKNYFDDYLDSRLANIEEKVGNLGEKVETASRNLEKTVDRALTEIAAVKKEASDSSRALTTWYIRGVWGVVGLFVAIAALVIGGYSYMAAISVNVNRDMRELRQEFGTNLGQIKHSIDSLGSQSGAPAKNGRN